MSAELDGSGLALFDFPYAPNPLREVCPTRLLLARFLEFNSANSTTGSEGPQIEDIYCDGICPGPMVERRTPGDLMLPDQPDRVICPKDYMATVEVTFIDSAGTQIDRRQ